jgi:hypothetical protein
MIRLRKTEQAAGALMDHHLLGTGREHIYCLGALNFHLSTLRHSLDWLQ